MPRKRVTVFFLSNLDIDEYALKYVVLSLNIRQDFFEFEFPDLVQLNIDRKFFFNQKVSETSSLFDNFTSLISKTISNTGLPRDYLPNEETPPRKVDYYIGITSIKIGKEEELFWTVKDNTAIITIEGWEKIYSPPSVFEYIIQSIAGVLVRMSSNIQTKKPIIEHALARGCILDDAYDKKDNKIDVSLGYICEECKSKISFSLGEHFLAAITKLCSNECLGDIETKETVAYNLKKFYKVDINRNSGINKSAWGKTRDSFLDLPKEIIAIGVTGLVALIIYMITSNWTFFP